LHAVVTNTTGDERIARHALSEREAGCIAFDNGAAKFMSQNQAWFTSWVVSVVGMHVRAAYAYCINAQNDFAGNQVWFRTVLDLDFEWVGVNKCFHGMSFELGCGLNGLAQAVDPLFDVSAGAD
jgi:hypothetical protein